MGFGGGAATYATRRAPRPAPRTRQVNPAQQGLDWTSFRPSDPRSPGYVSANVPGARQAYSTDPRQFTMGVQDWMQAGGGGYPLTQPMFPQNAPGSGGGRGGGGGGGGPAGVDQNTFDWLMARISAQPGMITYRNLDLPDPSQYMHWDPSQYDVASQGVNQGIEAMRKRGNTAFDTARGEVGRYQNPYAGGLQTQNPNQRAQMAAMARANDATSALQGVNAEGVQADRAFGNVAALMAANDQNRQAANLRALGADRQMMEQNLGLEGNMLNLGVNMARARGKTAFDQRLQDAMLSTAQQEAMQNYSRGNEVESTNIAARNAWMQQTLEALMGLAQSRAPGVGLPGDMSWFQAMGPGVDVSGGYGPVTAAAR